MKVKRTERGWAGHYICANRCLFRRNTLLEAGDTKIVVSTVGLQADHLRLRADHQMKDVDIYTEIGCDRYYETMAFHAMRVQDRYWDADVTRPIDFESNWAISELDADDRANDMHEDVVTEISAKLAKDPDQFNS